MLTNTICKWRLMLSAFLLTTALPTWANAKIASFPLDQIRLTAGPMAHAQTTNIDYLLRMEPDRLLAPYLKEAGITPKADSYGNWENSGLDGHIGGHYLTALSLAYGASGSPELKQRLDYMIDELQLAQQKNDGYLAGIPNGKAAWQQIKQANIKADLFSLNDRWVPLYNIDKIYHGLRDAYRVGGNKKARDMLIELSQWMFNLVADLTDEQVQQMLYSEHGGLTQVFVDVADISGDSRYLELARRFAHLKIIKPLVTGKDELTGLHANTQIPKILGMLQYAERTDNQDWIKGADYFWQTVTGNRSVSIGGNSVREHFHASDNFTAMVEDIEGPETCNTYNMMKLSLMLFKLTGEAKYFDFYERASYNHILSSQHPEHGGLVYFTSMRPGHYRMYSSVENSMWCCVGSGIENHSKYGELIYAHQDNALLVNMFVPSTLDWHQQGIKVSQKTAFPDAESVELVMTTNSQTPKELTIKIRQPSWLNTPIQLLVNDKKVQTKVEQGYLIINRKWQNGDSITFDLNAKLYAEQLPDGQSYYSLKYGPVVLATKVQAFDQEQLNFVADDSRMGHIAAGPTCPPEAVPIMLTEPAQFIANMQRLPGQLAYKVDKGIGTLASLSDLSPAELIPFYRLHDSRYQVYWPQLNKAEFSQHASKVKIKSATDKALVALTVDQITPGQQQPEVEHHFKGENTQAGVNNGHHWRDATGWFSYELSNAKLSAKALRIQYFKHDINRNFDILINGEVLQSVALKQKDVNEDFYTVDYPLTQSMLKQTTLVVKFTAHPDSIAGGIYGIRLIK